MGFSYPVDFRVKVIERVLDGASTEAVVASERIALDSVYRWLRWAGVKMRRGDTVHKEFRVVFPPAPVMKDAGGSGHGHRLDLADRTLIQLARESGARPAQIARMVGVHPSTISRELAHHGLIQRIQSGPAQYGYSAKLAQYRSDVERARPKKRKLDQHAHRRLRQVVVEE